MEISQFTYFQQSGGRELSPISVELTYGIERICMFLNDIKNIFDIPWNDNGVTYGDVRRMEEIEHSDYSFNEADVQFFGEQFGRWENEAQRLLARQRDGDGGTRPAPLVVPAYEAVLKCSHLFNVLDARGALSVTERAAHIQRIRRLSCACADAYVAVNNPEPAPEGQEETAS
jgi:glycyl-tRNA synthetase alpha chain